VAQYSGNRVAQIVEIRQFQRQERRVLLPKANETQIFSLQVHISSPLIRSLGLTDLNLLLANLTLKALTAGDPTVLVDPSTISVKGKNKDFKPLAAQNYSVSAYWYKESFRGILAYAAADRLEIRYFVGDVEKELAFYQDVLGGSREHYRDVLNKENQALATKKLFFLTASLKPEMLLLLFPLPTWPRYIETPEDQLVIDKVANITLEVLDKSPYLRDELGAYFTGDHGPTPEQNIITRFALDFVNAKIDKELSWNKIGIINLEAWAILYTNLKRLETSTHIELPAARSRLIENLKQRIQLSFFELPPTDPRSRPLYFRQSIDEIIKVLTLPNSETGSVIDSLIRENLMANIDTVSADKLNWFNYFLKPSIAEKERDYDGLMQSRIFFNQAKRYSDEKYRLISWYRNFEKQITQQRRRLKQCKALF
jgi:hypothetical protein